MRRYELIIILLLIFVIGLSWREMHGPTIPVDGLTLTQAQLLDLSPWKGPIAQARAARSEVAHSNGAGQLGDGKVLGIASDQQSGDQAKSNQSNGEEPDGQTLNQTPFTLLPVEKYTTPVFMYTLEQMLDNLKVVVHDEDIVYAFPDPSLGIGSMLTIYRATPVEVVDWGKKKNYRTWQSSVEDFLAEQGIELGDNDRVSPNLADTLTVKNKVAPVVIIRVAVTEVKVRKKIDFKVILKDDPNLSRGKVNIEKGVEGERLKVFRVTRENGVEVKRELLSNEVAKEPRDEVRTVGTKVLIGKTFTGRSSWYKYSSTKVASDLFKRGTKLRITNLANGKVIFVTNEGCICADTDYAVDLHPEYFQALGGTLAQGVLQNVKVDEILN